MAEDRDGEGTEDGATHAGRPDASAPRFGYNALPAIESPPLSPADPEPVPAPERKIQPQPEPEVAAAVEAAAETRDERDPGDGAAARLRARASVVLTQLNSLPLPSWRLFGLPSRPRVQLKTRHRRRIMLATTVALAAALGAAVGSRVDRGPVAPASDKAAQAAIAQLSREVDALKAKLVAKEAVEKQVADVETARSVPPSDVTGSIPPMVVPAPIPPPRPAEQIATAVNRPPLVRGWTLRVARNGLFLVEGRGEIYQVVPDAPLPGLGPVQAIKRQDGRWTVVTPKGLIVSRRDRRYFE